MWASEGAELTRLLGTGTLPLNFEGIAAWLEMAPALMVTGQELIEEYFGESMSAYLSDEQFMILFNFVMEEHAAQYLDNLAIEPLLGLLPADVLAAIPLVSDGAVVLGNEPMVSETMFATEGLEFLETLSSWLGVIGLAMMEFSEPFMTFDIENIAAIAGFDGSIELLNGMDVTTTLGSTVLDSPSLAVLYYLFNEFDPAELTDNIGLE